jgi:hypothetical protein
VDVAVIAVERFGQGADAGHVVTAYITQQLHPLGESTDLKNALKAPKCT